MAQSMAGKVCVVTGANAGIGRVTALELARQGAHVVMICRDPQRGQATQGEIIAASGNQAVDLLLADLGSIQSTRAVAAQFLAKYDRLDVLVNNAGAVFYERQETADGLEKTFALNHLGYFLLTTLLLDRLKASAPARIVNVSSDAHRAGRVNFDDLQNRQKYSGFPVYAESKLLNILFTRELARRLAGSGVTVNVLHPGFVRTNFGKTNTGLLAILFGLFSRLFAISPEKGAETSIYLATSPEVAGVSGQYFSNKKAVAPASQAQDEESARRLWAESERIVSAV